MLIFGQYLKQCREHLELSQRELVNQLSQFDNAFNCLDSTTLSRWERAINQPSVSKKMLIMRFVHLKSKEIFPLFNRQPLVEITKQLSSHRLSSPKMHFGRLIVKCPVDQIDHRNFLVHSIEDSAHQLAALNHNLLIYSEPHQRNFTFQQHHHLLRHPNNRFMVCDYFDQYLGHLFLITLKNESFSRLMGGQLKESVIGAIDTAGRNESGHYYIMGMFSLGTAAAHILICRLYALMIKHQQQIKGLAWLTCSQEQREWANHIGLQANKQITGDKRCQLYSSELQQLLINESIMKLIFK